MEESHRKESVGCKYHRMLMFYIPIMYALETRFLKRSKWGVLIWGTEYLFPVTMTLFLVVGMDICEIWIKFLLAIAGVYDFYEIGYIQNDCETIKKEASPTLRVSSAELAFYERAKFKIYGIRLILGVVFSLSCFVNGTSWVTLLVLWLIIPFYMLYNNLRGRINLYLILPLAIYRYCMPVSLVVYNHDAVFWYSWIMLVVAYPFLKFLEICAGGKSLPQEKWTIFILKNDDRFAFRVKYYFSVTICVFVFCLLNGNAPLLWYIPLYYFILRLLQLKMPKLGSR